MPSDSSERYVPGSLISAQPRHDGELSFSGAIDRVIFENKSNGYCVIRVLPEKKDAGRNGVPVHGFACTGTLPMPKGGMRLRFTGRFVNNPRFGRQFAFTEAVEQMPTSEAGLIGYLSSGLIKGMGLSMAERVVSKFGSDTMRVLDEEPELLLSVSGIGRKILTRIVESWNEHRGISSLIQFLQPHGISAAYGMRIYNAYGTMAMQIVRENPYRLAMDIRGIGFLTADAIAEKLGFPKDSPLRAQGAVLYILKKGTENGDVFLPRGVLMQRIEEELHIDSAVLAQAISSLELDERVVLDPELLAQNESGDSVGDQAVYLASYYKYETRTAYYLDRLQRMPRNVSFKDVDKMIREVVDEQEHRLAAAQTEAIHMASRDKVMVLTGGPGTGKTTIIKAILSLFDKVTKRVFLAAPTGRAAKRMAEATGREAVTLHRLLEYNPISNTFERNENQLLVCDLLIVDEASMMDVLLFYHLMKAVPGGCTVILVGDIHQLPSVGPGAVLADIIASGRVPVTRLNEIFRQSGTSTIVSNSHLINNGEMPKLAQPWERESDFFFVPVNDPEPAADVLVDLICREIPGRFGYVPLSGDIQLLTPMHKGAVGTINMNARLQEKLNPVPAGRTVVQLQRGNVVYRVNDKVMQTRNNYTKEIFNGDLGVIKEIDKETRQVTVRFDERDVTLAADELDDLVLAYAISIHKSQGSEYPCVVIPLFMQHYVMLQRNLIYTAITRGKQLVVVVGDPRALCHAVRNASVRRRCTRLAWRLMHYRPVLEA